MRNFITIISLVIFALLGLAGCGMSAEEIQALIDEEVADALENDIENIVDDKVDDKEAERLVIDWENTWFEPSEGLPIHYINSRCYDAVDIMGSERRFEAQQIYYMGFDSGTLQCSIIWNFGNSEASVYMRIYGKDGEGVEHEMRGEQHFPQTVQYVGDDEILVELSSGNAGSSYQNLRLVKSPGVSSEEAVQVWLWGVQSGGIGAWPLLADKSAYPDEVQWFEVYDYNPAL